MEKNNNKWLVITAFLIPVIFILGVVVVTRSPIDSVSSEYDFVYVSCDTNQGYNYECYQYLDDAFVIKDGKLTKGNINPTLDIDRDGIKDTEENYSFRLFVHNTDSNESREVLFEDIANLEISGLLTSPDGITFSEGDQRNSDILMIFGGGYDYGYYLTKGNKKDRMNMINDLDGYYEEQIRFIGWIAR